ncbi:MAG: helix-turn-helix transcriptional regulator [Rhodothermales bacterium]
MTASSDSALLAELGERLSDLRIAAGLTQAQVASRGGVSKRTVERLEAGESVQLTSLLRVLRVLNLLDGIDRLVPKPEPSPMQLLKLHGKERQRASGTPRVGEKPAKQWTWGEDQ